MTNQQRVLIELLRNGPRHSPTLSWVLGEPGLSWSAISELRAKGLVARVQKHAASSPVQLTPEGRRVARLLSEGQRRTLISEIIEASS